MLEFHGPHPWEAITKTAQMAGPRFAAIAFIGADAPRMLPLEKDDVLVVNASDAAVASHATSPKALLAFLKRGVQVRNDPALHAKVVAVRARAVVGSANASSNSQSVHEAVIVSNEPHLAQAVKDFVQVRAAESESLTRERLNQLQAVWDANTPARVPGVTSTPPHLRDTGRVFIESTEPADEPEFKDAGAKRRARRSLPAARYALSAFSTGGSRPWKAGDAIILVGGPDDPATLHRVVVPNLETTDGNLASLLCEEVEQPQITLRDLRQRSSKRGYRLRSGRVSDSTKGRFLVESLSVV